MGLMFVGFLVGCAHPPPPMMPAYDPQAAVEICAGGECGKAGEKFALKDIAKAMGDMFAANGPGVWTFCAASRDSKRCTQNQITYTVNGAIPATGYVPGAALRAGAKYDGKRGVSFRVNIPTIVFNTPSVCDDARSKLVVRSSNNIFWQSNVYMCSWGGGRKNIKAEGQYGIDYIDFDRGVMGGEFAIRVSEGGNGYTKGYAITTLPIGMDEVQQAWLRPLGPMAAARVKTAAAPVYTPLAVSPSALQLPVTPLMNDVDRYALVIGNSAYQYTAKLPNPVNDARLIAGTLQSLGFNVTLLTDSTRQAIKRSVVDFEEKLRTAKRSSIGLFYYAGHGVQVKGRNYLIPVDAQINREYEVETEAFDVQMVLGAMEYAGNGMNIVVLDACRNNPFARSFRSVSRGLARMDAPSGTMIAYATAPGDVAADGEGTNSPYSEALAAAMRVKGIPIEKMFKQVRILVRERTGKEQTPWEASSLTGDFFFNP
ncbi:MAG: hypothetical protein COB46_11360 [Rhodospirillaceae bacterium]|nr:MAG: hypothetical protein COB46_11360 [Rhodospirillaceae bacterium]